MPGRNRVRIILHPHQGLQEIQRDSVRALERGLLRRGFHRRGDIIEIPITNSHMQKLLKLTGARRSGNHYARACIAELRAMNIIEDTGRVIVPAKQPSRQQSKWWRVYRILPVVRAIRSLTPHAYGYRREVSDLQASLLSFVQRQLSRNGDYRPSQGSVQEAFHELGPP